MLTHDRVSITATNGQIAACVESPADYTGDGTEEYLLHPRVITALAPLSIKEDAPEILIGSDGRRYLLRFGEYEITVSIPSCASRRSSIDAVIKALSPTPWSGCRYRRIQLDAVPGARKTSGQQRQKTTGIPVR